MPQKSRAIGIVIVLGSLWTSVAIAPGASFSTFIDYPAIIMIVGLVAGGLLMAFRPATVFDAFRKSILGFREANPRNLGQYNAIFSRAYQLTWGAGIVITLMGVIIMLGNMDNPEAIGPGMAVAMLSLLYAAFLAEVVITMLQQSLINNADVEAVPATASVASGSGLSGMSRSMVGTGIAVLFLVLMQVFVLVAALDFSSDTDAIENSGRQRPGTMTYFSKNSHETAGLDQLVPVPETSTRLR